MCKGRKIGIKYDNPCTDAERSNFELLKLKAELYTVRELLANAYLENSQLNVVITSLEVAKEKALKEGRDAKLEAKVYINMLNSVGGDNYED